MKPSRQCLAKRRVLVLVNDLGTGGAQRTAMDQAAGLDPDCFDVELLSLELDGRTEWKSDHDRHVPIRRLRPPGTNVALAWPALIREIKRFQPDLVHSHLAAAGLIGTIMARTLGVPRVVTTFHNLTDWEEKRFHPLRVAARSACRWCDRLVAVSEAVRAAIQGLDPRLGQRTEVIPNGVDLDRFSQLGGHREPVRARLRFDHADFVVGAVARLDSRKGLDVLIEAVHRARQVLPELKLLLVGDGSERARLESLVRVRDLLDSVLFVGASPDPRPFLAAMDLFAAPSRTEGLGIAIIEAMAAGLPVLCARVGGIPELVSDGVCGRLLPHDATQLWADALVDLGSRPNERRRLAMNSPACAARFSLGAAVERVERLYRSLFESERGVLRETA